MGKYIYLSLLSFLGHAVRGQKSYNLSSFRGTWVNLDVYKNLQGFNHGITQWDYQTPRLVSIDELGSYEFEMEPEQKNNSVHPTPTIDKQGNTILYLRHATIRHRTDSIIEYDSDEPQERLIFKKVSNDWRCIACGIQYLFHYIYWDNKPRWKLSEYKDGEPIKESNIRITYQNFLDSSKTILWQYEFLDQLRANKNAIDTISFFQTDKDQMITTSTEYGIKKIQNIVYIYDGAGIKYSLKNLQPDKP